MLHARQLRGFARREAEQRTGKGFEDQVLRAVGQHRDEDEDREAPRIGIAPDLAQRGAKVGPHRAGRRGGRRLGAALQAAQRQHRDQHRDQGHRRRHRHQALRRVGVEETPGQAGGDGEADDHHHPHGGGRRGAALLGHALGQQHQQRGAGGADAQADQREGQHRQCHAGPALGAHPGHGQRGAQAAAGQHRHAAEDPGRASLAAIGAVAHARPRHLHRVVQRHQQPRQQGRQGQFDDHHPIQCRGGQHHHCTEHGLHQPEPEDAGPAQHGSRRHGAAPARLRKAKALTIMPETNSGTPKPL